MLYKAMMNKLPAMEELPMVLFAIPTNKRGRSRTKRMPTLST
jgi:hypothetical protein